MLLDSGDAEAAVNAVLAEVVHRGGRACRTPAPGHVRERSVGDRTRRWLNAFGGLWRCTEWTALFVDRYLFLAASVDVVQKLPCAAMQTFRWPTRSKAGRLQRAD